MRQRIHRLFLNDRFILSVILINSCIIYAQVAGVCNIVLDSLDLLCLLIFIAEMIVKHIEYGVRGYWKDGWNRLDGLLVILSLPTLVELFIPLDMMNLSFLMILRMLRIVRFFRVLHFFPNFSKVVKGFKDAMHDSYAILLSFFVIIVIFGLINLRSIYAVFQMCTLEGWYEIPNTVAAYYGGATVAAELVRIYFCILLILGGIIGMSFLNSIFVDAMVADNNDDVKAKLDEMQKTLDELNEKINQLNKKQ